MENPHELPAPEDSIERIHAFARDLAYGVAQGWWTTEFDIDRVSGSENWFYQYPEGFSYKSDRLFSKWHSKLPSRSLLESYGYLEMSERMPQKGFTFVLTEKAICLLEKPASPPSVFISYKHNQSSAFALLVEARLRLAGNQNPFLDKSINAGDEWEPLLEKKVRESKFLVCLIGKRTLESDWVKKEIGWATESGTTIISIWHGCDIDESTLPALKARHRIKVMAENATEYEVAISKMLNAMGYATY